MTSQLCLPLSLAIFVLFSIAFPGLSHGWKSDAELIQKWEERQKTKAQAPFLRGKAWDKLQETFTSTYAAAGANSGGVMEEAGDTLSQFSPKKLKQALRETGTKGRDINKAVKPLKKLRENVQAAGGTLKKIGKVATLADEAGNLGSFAGALQGGDIVGAGEAVVNRSLAAAAATAGGFGGGKIAAAGAILLGLTPPVALTVGVVGIVAGAVSTSITYDEYGKPIVSKTADDIESKRADWEAQERNRLGRIRADMQIIGLDEPQDPSISSVGRTSSPALPVDGGLLRASDISDADAAILRKMAREKLAKRQAAKKKLEEARKQAEAEEEARKKAEAEEEARKNAEAEKAAWGEGGYEETTDAEKTAGKKAEAEKAAWGEGGYEETSPGASLAARLVKGILEATQSCDYLRALALADQAWAAQPDNAWLKHNYGNIQLSARRLIAYNSAYNTALLNLKSGDYPQATAALSIAMNNASIDCGQDKIVRTLHERATEIEKMVTRESIINKAKREGEWSASKRDRERERYAQELELQKRSAQALHGVMLDALKAASQGNSNGNSSPSIGYTGSGRKSGGSISSPTNTNCQRIMDEMNSLSSQIVNSGKRHGQLGSADSKAVQDSGQNLQRLQQRQNQLMSEARSMGCL
jgi:hypothetical protein